MPCARLTLRERDVLPGVHRVTRAHVDGRVTAYWYAWRGGPRILRVTARSDAECGRLIAAQLSTAVAEYQRLVQPRAADHVLSGLIQRYLESGDYARLAPRTKRDRRQHLDFVRMHHGEMPLKVLDASGVRRKLIAWRDQFQSTPKTADERLGALAYVLGWAAKRGDIDRNPLEDWPRLYRANRADIIWRDEDLAKLFGHSDNEFRRAVQLAASTGLRLGDLVRLSWTDVGVRAITLTTAKSGHRRVVTIPITPKVRAVLDEIGAKDEGPVLLHSRGNAWTKEGLQTAMQRAKDKAGIANLRFHDLRGTAATHFVQAGLALSDVATVMGWTPNKVEGIARRYVTSEAVADGMLQRMRSQETPA